MRARPTPTEFRGKTWISWVSAVVCGYFAVFGLVMGPLFLTGVMKTADGRPGIAGGIALSICGIGLSPFAALALFRAIALGRPLLRLRREGIVVNLIGVSSLDGLPKIPGFGREIALLRAAWLIVSLQGFKQQTVYAPWQAIQDVQVWGLAMHRKLTIFAPFFRPVSHGMPPECISEELTFEEVAFAAALDDVARSILVYSADARARESLPSWET